MLIRIVDIILDYYYIYKNSAIGHVFYCVELFVCVVDVGLICVI